MYDSSMNDAGEETVLGSRSPDTTIFSLLHAAQALEDKLEDVLRQVGLSTPKYSVLAELCAAGTPLSLSELANKLSCVRSNMTQPSPHQPQCGHGARKAYGGSVEAGTGSGRAAT